MTRKRMFAADDITDERRLACAVPARELHSGMVLHADDYGRGRASPLALKARVFPTDPFTPEEVEHWLLELESVGLVQVYGTAREFYFIIEWFERQKISHPTESRLPAPPEMVGGIPDNSGTFRKTSEPLRPVSLVSKEAGQKEPGSRKYLLGIYRDTFTDKHGTPPTKAEMERLGSHLKGWLSKFSPEEVAAGIDAFFAQPTRTDHGVNNLTAYFNRDYTATLATARKRAASQRESEELMALDLLTRAEEELDPRPSDPDAWWEAKRAQLPDNWQTMPQVSAGVQRVLALLGRDHDASPTH